MAFRFSDDFQKKYPDVQQKWIQTLLRVKGWIVPNYELAPDLEKVEILRVVVRENMTETVRPHCRHRLFGPYSKFIMVACRQAHL